MRALLLLMIALPALVFSQGPATDILVTITPNERTNTDLVEMAAVKPGYPPDLLRQQAADISRRIGVPARGYMPLDSKIGDQVFTKCSFGSTGLIDRTTGKVRLSPIVQGLAGAPDPYTVKGIIIIFQGVVPIGETLREFESKGVRVIANSIANPPQIEYRVELRSQNPDEVSIPDEKKEQKPVANSSSQRQKGLDLMLWGAIVVAALAASFIVYTLLIRTGPKRRG